MVRWSLCLAVTALSLASASAQTMLGAADILDAVPSSVPLSEARAVALIPAGRGTSLQGVLFVKGESGWSEPEFVVLRDLPPSSRESQDYVLIFRTRRGADRVANGDGRLDPEVVAYTGRGSTFATVSLDGASLRKSGPFVGTPDRKLAAELKAKLTELMAPKFGPAEAKMPIAVDWSRVVEQREVFLGGFAALGAWLAMLKRRKR